MSKGPRNSKSKLKLMPQMLCYNIYFLIAIGKLVIFNAMFEMTQSKTKISGLVKITKKINTSIVIVSHRRLNITIFFLLVIKVASNQRDALSNARVNSNQCWWSRHSHPQSSLLLKLLDSKLVHHVDHPHNDGKKADRVNKRTAIMTPDTEFAVLKLKRT